jgi:hypothetical protein
MSDEKSPRGPAGSGSEATEGIHSADGKPSGAKRQSSDRPGSEPTESHDTEHRSKYGGGSRREDGGGQRSA